MKHVSEEEYLEACDEYAGWCTCCEEFTRYHTEPDAMRYDCPVCRGRTVYGAEQALLMGLIEIGDE